MPVFDYMDEWGPEKVLVVYDTKLARNMTWKWALVDIFLGGAKAAIVADPKAPNKEGIVRAFVRAIRKLLPDEYV
jgi:glutamate dehydrogenase (NAD(P)+)